MCVCRVNVIISVISRYYYYCHYDYRYAIIIIMIGINKRILLFIIREINRL